MGKARAVSQGDALQHLALSEYVWERAEKSADGPVESFWVLAEQDEPEYAQVEYVGRGSERRAKDSA